MNSTEKLFKSFKHRFEIRVDGVTIHHCDIARKPNNNKELLDLIESLIELVEATK